MEEGSRAGSDGASPSSSALLCGGGRQRFEVELRPGETTIVSWKKLLKDANKAAGSNKPRPTPAPPVPFTVDANQALESLNAPLSKESAEREANEAPHGSRFGAVIEKIERLYMGKNSSDEEDLNDVPDDDEYDTGDSFIDDAELDEYFQVDNSAIKHDGFFVNRGKLEHSTVPQKEATGLPSEQPKKRRRKDSAKVYGSNNSGKLNDAKVNNKATGKVVIPIDKVSTVSPQSNALSTVNSQDLKNQNPTTPAKKLSDSKSLVDSSLTSALNSDHGSKLNQSPLTKDKNVIRVHSEAKATENTPQTTRTPLTVRKEGSHTKSKSTLLEKAIKDLEKIVLESRPPSLEIAAADSSSPAVKKRMPPEIKHKLAKVARLAHAINGKISKELLNRLMSIVGHLIKLRSLRSNLMNMVNMGLSAKEEKGAKMQQLKKQIEDIVKIRAPIMKSKAMEQQVGSSDDFQESGTKEKEVVKRSITMDDTLEDKICDLYDLFVEGLDEDAGPQVRKLYAELAELWPQGFMDNHGIRHAICRAKDRRKALHRHKEQEKLKRKKIIPTKTSCINIESGCVAPAQNGEENISSTAANPVRSVSNTLPTVKATSQSPIKPKQEKLKANNSESGIMPLVKKVKRKADGESQIQQDKTMKPSTTNADAPQPVLSNSAAHMG